jgi:hypothetical protein
VRELFVRHARKDGRSLAVLRALEAAGAYVVEAEVHPAEGEPVRPGPYRFADGREATAFVTEAVEALLYLGCDVRAE